MHLADGVLTTEIAVLTSVGATAALAYSIHGTKEGEIPKISLMSAVFFTFSMLSLPLGPSSVHLLLAALMGIVLKKRSVVAIFVGLVLQAVVFQHGGITTLGANTLLVGLPALISWKFFNYGRNKGFSPVVLSGILGGLAVVICVALLVVVLLGTDSMYGQGRVSTIRLIALTHLPLIFFEGGITSVAVGYLTKTTKFSFEERSL